MNAPAYPAANWLAAVRSLRLPLLTSAALIAINRFVPPAPMTSLSLLSIHYLAQIRKRPLQ